MKKLLSIAALLLLVVTFISCEKESVLTEQEQIELSQLETYAKDGGTEPENDGTVDDGETDEE